VSEDTLQKREKADSIAWMVHNRITPNILMMVLLIGGLFVALMIRQEVFPAFEDDTVTIRVPYPGASPEEVEQGIILSTEEAIRGLEGVKEVRSVASEGSGTVTVELLEGADRQKAYQDIQQEVDRITTYPDDAEEPAVTLNVHKRDVLEVHLYGRVDESALREAVEHVRDRLLQHEGITQIELEGARDYEIHVEVSQESLRRFDLTLEDVAAKVARTAVEIPGGKIDTSGGEILLRFKERRDWARQFRRIPIVADSSGTLVRLEDIAQVYEGFEDTDTEASFNGMRDIGIEIFRIGDQTPIGVSDAVHEAMADIAPEIPTGIDWVIHSDRSSYYRQRLSLLLKNAFIGLVLVLALLGLFLEFKLAFWVTMGIPISFLGGLLFLPMMDVSINMISMFAFIIALGIVVDDAIVAGENIYEYRSKGMGPIEAAIQGARDVMMPVTFSILSNILAFLPLYFVPGVMGKVWGVIPLVVCTVFAISLVEALWILPSHLAHTRSEGFVGLTRMLHRWQQGFARLISRFIQNGFGPFLRLVLRFRPLVLACAAAILLLTVAFIASGRMGFILMPKVESDRSVVTATLPYGSPIERVRRVESKLIQGAEQVIAENGGDRLSEGIASRINENEVRVDVYLTEPKIRPITTGKFTNLWRERVGALHGLQSVRYESDRGGPGRGPSLTVELSHRDIDTLDRASQALAERLAEFAATKDIDDGYTPGKQQLNFKITPAGESLGLTAKDIATQLRHAFQGREAIKQQRGRNEVTVRVRRPEAERTNEYDVEQMIIATPEGGQVPLMVVADVERGRAYTTINRRDGRRTVSVTAGVEPIGETSRIQAELKAEALPRLIRDFPGLTYSFEGRQAALAESFQALLRGMGFALLGIYVLLAIPFRSYAQPLIVMLAIPFGIVGGTLGHLIMGYNLSITSCMGMVALAGVVVNDSLVLINYTNRLRREEGLRPRDAVHAAAVRRFRPVLLTTLTTFGGLAPMIFETSRQARFMIPMAISLGFGILFATLITLVIIPTMYVLLEDVKASLNKVLNPAERASEILPQNPPSTYR
jgi:multidrug efflux pump subunit AcrB